jgi:hypothetical protein
MPIQYDSSGKQVTSTTTNGAIDAGTNAVGELSRTADKSSSYVQTAATGLGAAGVAAAVSSGKASLNLSGIAAAAAVALNVGQLIKQGQAAKTQFAQKKLAKGQEFSVNASGINLNQKKSAEQLISSRRDSLFTSLRKFPGDLPSEYNLTVKMYPFKRLNKDNRSYVSGNPHTVIKLPLPTNLVDAISLTYSEVSLGMIGGEVFSSLYRNFSENQGNYLQAISGTFEDMKGYYQDPMSGFRQALLRKLIGGVIGEAGTTAMNLATGNVPNPHMAVSFQNVNLKRYNFSWRLSPNNVEESKELEDIVLNLQAGSLPRRGPFLLDFPDVVQLDMSPTGLFYFKPMVIDSVVVNYAPSGVPSFFKNEDGTNKKYPTEINLEISLKELDIHTNDDPRYTLTRVGQEIRDETQVGFTDDTRASSRSFSNEITNRDIFSGEGE